MEPVFAACSWPDNAAQRETDRGKYAVDGDASASRRCSRSIRPQYEIRATSASSATGRCQPVHRGDVALPAAPRIRAGPCDASLPERRRRPENQLRMYIHFSGADGPARRLEHVTLLDDRAPVVDPFLPVDGEFWNADRTRYTVFFDPGRQKRGILPNREMGASLVAGRQLHARRRSRLARRQRPAARARRSRDVPRRPRPISRRSTSPPGRSRRPREGTRDPLPVTFRSRSITVCCCARLACGATARRSSGEVRVDANETRWTMTPNEPWRPGATS